MTQRISYVPLEDMTPEMRAEMERCAREGTPRPESTAVRAHVPAAFWFFANCVARPLPQRDRRPRHSRSCAASTSRAASSASTAATSARCRARGSGLDEGSTTSCSTSRLADATTSARRPRSPTPRRSPGDGETDDAFWARMYAPLLRARAGRARLHDRADARPAELAADAQHRAPRGARRQRPPRWRPGYETAEAVRRARRPTTTGPRPESARRAGRVHWSARGPAGRLTGRARGQLGAQRDMSCPGVETGARDLDRPVRRRRSVLEQVQRARRDRHTQPHGRQRRVQVVGAVVVPGRAQQLVAIAVAGGQQRVVDAAGRVFDEREDRRGDTFVTKVSPSRGFTRPMCRRLCSIDIHSPCVDERPRVDDLLAVRVDDPHPLPAGDPHRDGTAGGDQLQSGHAGLIRRAHSRASSPASTHWRPSTTIGVLSRMYPLPARWSCTSVSAAILTRILRCPARAR